MSMVRNERTKLWATALNNVAVAIFVTTLIAPLASFFYGLSHPDGGKWWLVIGFAWLVADGILHLFAQLVLGRLIA